MMSIHVFRMMLQLNLVRNLCLRYTSVHPLDISNINSSWQHSSCNMQADACLLRLHAMAQRHQEYGHVEKKVMAACMNGQISVDNDSIGTRSPLHMHIHLLSIHKIDSAGSSLLQKVVGCCWNVCKRYGHIKQNL